MRELRRSLWQRKEKSPWRKLNARCANVHNRWECPKPSAKNRANVKAVARPFVEKNAASSAIIAISAAPLARNSQAFVSTGEIISPKIRTVPLSFPKTLLFWGFMGMSCTNGMPFCVMMTGCFVSLIFFSTSKQSVLNLFTSIKLLFQECKEKFLPISQLSE